MLSKISCFLGFIFLTRSQIISRVSADRSIFPLGSINSDHEVVDKQFSLVGAYYFNNEFDTNMTKIIQMERWMGGGISLSKNAVLHFFTQWCPALASSLDWYTTSTIRTHLNKFWNAGSVPLMSWQPACYDPSLPTLSTLERSSNTKTPDNFVKWIGDGKYDSYIIKVALEYKTFLAGPDNIYGTADDRRAYIRLGHEMNGNWYQWSVAKNTFITATDYQNMWIRVRQVFDSQLSSSVINGVTTTVDSSSRMQWMWCPNNFDTGGVIAESYYPGDQYVDWLAFDVYNPVNNGGNSPSAAVLMLPMIQRLQAMSPLKPVAIPEYGTSYIASQGIDRKAKWLDEFFNITKQYGIGMTVLFNVGSNSVYGSSTVPNIDEYVNIVKRGANWINHGNQSNARLIADEAFKGYIPTYSTSSSTVTIPPATSISTTSAPSKSPTKLPLSTYIPSNDPSVSPTALVTTAPSGVPTFTPSHESTTEPTESLSSPVFVQTIVQTFVGITLATFFTNGAARALQSTVIDILHNNDTLRVSIDISSVTVLTATDSASVSRFQSKEVITTVTYSILFLYLQQQRQNNEPEATFDLIIAQLNSAIFSGMFTTLLRMYAYLLEADSLTTVLANSLLSTTTLDSLKAPTVSPTASQFMVTPTVVVTTSAPAGDTSGSRGESVSSSVSSGAVAGIVIGVMAGMVALMFMLYLFCYHRQLKSYEDATKYTNIIPDQNNKSSCSDGMSTEAAIKNISSSTNYTSRSADISYVAHNAVDDNDMHE